MKIKLMQFNILHGFHQVTAPFKFEEKRLDAAKEAIKLENPDILVLVEAAYGGSNPFGINMDYPKIFNYPYSYFAPWGAYEWGNCLLSKFPISGETVELANRTALRAKIKLGKKTLSLDVFHPSPDLTENEKVETVKALLKENPRTYVLTGDFNSLSDEDIYDQSKMLNGFKRFDKSAEKTVKELFERKLIPYIKSQGLKDTFTPKTRHYTIPTNFCSLVKDSAMRIDYFFASKNMKVLESKVIINDLTEIASDHYPISVKFDI